MNIFILLAIITLPNLNNTRCIHGRFRNDFLHYVISINLIIFYVAVPVVLVLKTEAQKEICYYRKTIIKHLKYFYVIKNVMKYMSYSILSLLEVSNRFSGIKFIFWWLITHVRPPSAGFTFKTFFFFKALCTIMVIMLYIVISEIFV